MPFQVIYINLMVARPVMGQGKNLSVLNGFGFVKLRVIDFKESGLVAVFIGFAIHRIASTDELFQPKSFKVLGKKLGKVAPFGVITG